jgi:hypothetical protein
MALFLVKRGPRPSHHRAPFHPVIISPSRNVARWEAGWTGDRAWIWSRASNEGGSGWLLDRWDGLDIDYGHIVRGCLLPGGVSAGIEHDRRREPWTLVDRATWWSTRKPPAWLLEMGLRYPADAFSQETIRRVEADDGCTKLKWRHVLRPDFWPVGKVACDNCAAFPHTPVLHDPPACPRPPHDPATTIRFFRWKNPDLHLPKEEPALFEVHERYSRVWGVFRVYRDGSLGRICVRDLIRRIPLEGVEVAPQEGPR